jgi:hypothetical protein
MSHFPTDKFFSLPLSCSSFFLFCDNLFFNKLQFWKVRLHALFVIRALVQCLGSARFVQYWTQFLPSSQSVRHSFITFDNASA